MDGEQSNKSHDFILIEDSGIIKTVLCENCGQEITGTIIDLAVHLSECLKTDHIPNKITIEDKHE